MRPGPEVLASFSAKADPVPLPGGEGGQLLARALVYRLVTEVIFRRDDAAGLAAVARGSQPVTGLVLARLAVGLRIR